jgi:flagellin-like hook-associated protein FlgL
MAFPPRRDKSQPALSSTTTTDSQPTPGTPRRTKKSRHHRRGEKSSPRLLLKRIQQRKVNLSFSAANLPSPQHPSGEAKTPKSEERRKEASIDPPATPEGEKGVTDSSATDVAGTDSKENMDMEKESPVALAEVNSPTAEEGNVGVDDVARADSDGASTSSNDSNDTTADISVGEATFLASEAIARAEQDTVTASSPISEHHQEHITHTCGGTEADGEFDCGDSSLERGEVLENLGPKDHDGDSVMVDADVSIMSASVQSEVEHQGKGDGDSHEARAIERVRELISYFDIIRLHSSPPEIREGQLETLRTTGVIPRTYVYHERPGAQAGAEQGQRLVEPALVGLFDGMKEGAAVTEKRLEDLSDQMRKFLMRLSTGLRRLRASQDPSLIPSFAKKPLPKEYPSGFTGPAVARVDLTALFRSYVRHGAADMIRASLRLSGFDMAFIKDRFPQLFSCIHDEEDRQLSLRTVIAARCGATEKPADRVCWPCYRDILDELEEEYRAARPGDVDSEDEASVKLQSDTV